MQKNSVENGTRLPVLIVAVVLMMGLVLLIMTKARTNSTPTPPSEPQATPVAQAAVADEVQEPVPQVEEPAVVAEAVTEEVQEEPAAQAEEAPKAQPVMAAFTVRHKLSSGPRPEQMSVENGK